MWTTTLCELDWGGCHWRLLGCWVVDYYDGLWHRLESPLPCHNLQMQAISFSVMYLSIP